MRRVGLVLIAAAALLAACDRPPSPSDAAFDARVRDYLLAHPEVLEEAMGRLQERRQAEGAREVAVALRQQRRALERDPRDFVANPNGTVTVTQFYDYRCTHCITAAPQVLALVRSRPEVRVVFKELPVFGGTSIRAARLALAVRRSGGDYLGAYRDMTSARPLDDAAVNRIAASHGVAPAELDNDGGPSAEHLQAVQALANALRIDGTPTFVVGDRVIPGADMAALDEAITAAGSRAS